MAIPGCRTQPLLMMAILNNHMKESGTYILSLHGQKRSNIRLSRSGLKEVCLTPQTLKIMISQQQHSNWGWKNAPYPYRTYDAIPLARGILPRNNKTDRYNITDHMQEENAWLLVPRGI